MKKHLLFILLLLPVVMSAQTVKFGSRTSTLSQVFQTIEKQTSLTVAYNDNIVDAGKTVSVPQGSVDLKDALKEILRNTGYTFRFHNNIILIVKEDSKPETIVYSGTVTDTRNEPLPGTVIMLEDSGVSTIADENGKFSIRGKEGDLIRVSILGYSETISVLGSPSKPVNIVLDNDTNYLDEVVIVGYGTQKNVNLTGAVSATSGDVLEDRPIGNIAQGLQGVIPNLNITFNSGKPDTKAAINIRGNTSLNGGSALILLDGVEISDLSLVNPNDIESISVLKDASAAAVYGARAAFGVMLLTTKKGAKSSRTRVTYSNNFSWNTPARLPEMASSDVWCRMWNMAMEYDNPGTYYFSDRFLELLDAHMADPANNPGVVVDTEGIQDYRHTPSDPGWAYVSNTDWLKAFYRNSGLMHQHNVSATGGNDVLSYYASVGYKNQQGIFRYGNDKYSRFNGNLNLDAKLADWIDVGFSVRMNKTQTDDPNVDFQNNSGYTLYYEVYRMFPTVPVFLPNGDWAGLDGYHMNYNIVGRMALAGRSVTSTWDNLYTGRIDIHPFKGFAIKGDYSYNTYFSKQKKHGKTYSQTYPEGREPVISGSPSNVTNYNANNIYQALNLWAEYSHSFKKGHNLKVMAGYNQEEKKYSSNSLTMTGLYDNSLPMADMASDYLSNSEVKTLWRVQGIFFRANYDYKGRYLLEVNGRYDGSSKYAANDRWAFFPSASAGWNLAEESWLKAHQNKVNLLKLRASVGALGNQVTTGYHDYMSVITSSTIKNYLFDGALSNGLSTPSVPSYVSWEKVVTYDAGLDWGFLDNRLTGSFDYYIRQTKGMVRSVTLPAVFGTSTGKENLADMRTNGWEFEVSWRDRVGNVAGSPLDYNVGIGLSDYQAVITKYDNPTGSIASGMYYKGQKLGEIWGYVTDGFIQTGEEALEMDTVQKYLSAKWFPGDIRYKDLNNDGKIDEGMRTLDDPGDKKVIGNNTPRYRFNINGGISWKGVSLDFLFEGVAKRDLWTGSDLFWGFGRGIYNSSVTEYHVKNTWTFDNTDAYYPRLSMGGNAKSKQVQTKYLQNAAYLRLKNLTIGYTFPERLTRKVGISGLKIYATGMNLWEVTGLPDFMTPDIADNIVNSVLNSGNAGKEYAFMRNYSFGVNITF